MAEYPGAAWAGVSPNRSDRQGKVRLFIVHHYAGTQDPASARARFMSSNDRSVSPNYQVNADGSVYEIVPPDRFRAWTTGTIDHQAVTCETQNTSGAPTWGISRESHEAIAHLVAWAAQRYGFPIQRGRVEDENVVAVPGVVGHRETPAGRATATACPGPSMDIDWIVNRARQIAGGSAASSGSKPSPVPPPPPPPPPIPEEVFEMATRFITTDRNGGTPIPDEKCRGAFVDTESGFECSISWFTLADADAFARAASGNEKAVAVRLSDAGFDKFVASLAAVRKK